MARTFEITTEGNAAKIVVDGNEISDVIECNLRKTTKEPYWRLRLQLLEMYHTTINQLKSLVRRPMVQLQRRSEEPF